MPVSHNNTKSFNQASEEGFTLIELSIVLVIIGLIVGGILTGQDLIKAAEQRATIAQIEKYNTAVNTFRNKFGGIPGDLPYTTANSFGISSQATLTAGGDGNGLIEGSGADKVSFAGEPVEFWNELTMASLVDGSFGTAMTAAGLMAADANTVAKANNYMPPAKLGRGNSVNVASASGINYFLIGGFGTGTGITAASGLYNAQTNTLAPLEAYNIDKKTDDGLPLTGSIKAIDMVAVLVAASLTSPAPVAGCVTSSAYVVTAATGSTPSCSLMARFN